MQWIRVYSYCCAGLVTMLVFMNAAISDGIKMDPKAIAVGFLFGVIISTVVGCVLIEMEGTK